MRLKQGIFLLVAYVISVHPAFAQAEKTDLTIGKLIERVIMNNSDISISIDNLRIANLEYRETLADNAPTLTLDKTGYEVTKSVDELINKFEFGLEYRQKLPTSGSLAIGLENDFTLRIVDGEDLYYKQTPSISLGWTQPVFVNGKFIDTDVFAAENQKAKLDRDKTQESTDETTSSVIQDAIISFFDVIDKRNDAAYQSDRLEWHRRDLMNLEKKRDLKLIIETEVWEKKLEIGDFEEELYTLRLTLQESEKNLAHHLGLDDLSTLRLKRELPTIEPQIVLSDLSQKVLDNNPGVAKEEISLKSAHLDIIIDDLSYASTLEVDLSFAPRYPSVGSGVIYPRSFSESFSRFVEAESDYNLTLSLLLTIPLIDGGKRSLEREKNQKLEKIAFQELQNQKRLMLKDLEIVIQKRDNLMEKVNLLRDHVQLNKKQLDIQEKLFELKQITMHDVESVKLDLVNQENKLWRAKADLLVATIDLFSIAGENLITKLTAPIR